MNALAPPDNAARRGGAVRRTSLAVGASLGLTLAVAQGVAPAAAADPDCSTYPWMDTSKTADQRAHALLDASTLDQKLRWLNEQAANNPTQTVFVRQRPRNIPPSVPIDQTPFTMPAQVPCTPTIQYADGPQNVNAGTGVTYFPAPIAQAAAWNTDLAYDKGAAQGDEAWLKARNVLLAPGLASGRDPRNGRTSEYLGEDPLLGGLTAGAGSKGINSNPERAGRGAAEALRRQRAGDRPAAQLVQHGPAHASGDLHPAFRDRHRPWRRRQRDVRVQRPQQRLDLRQRHPAASDPQDRDRLRRLRDDRLRFHSPPHRRPAFVARRS